MAKLYFYYAAMNAGKSTILLQSAYNYKERGMDSILFTPAIDDRFTYGKVHSRLGINADAIPFAKDTNLFSITQNKLAQNSKIKCVLVDEAQFLSRQQVEQLTDIVDELDLPVLAYGLRSDFQAQAFEGSQYLLILADNLIELKTICYCGKKAIMNLRVDEKGRAVIQGEQVQIGGNDSYTSVCRKHFKLARKKTQEETNT